MSFETYFYMFLSWYLKNPGHLSELLLYEVTEVSLTVSSSGSMTDTGPLNTGNTLYNDIPKPTLCSFKDTHRLLSKWWVNLFDEDGRGFICSLEATLIRKCRR